MPTEPASATEAIRDEAIGVDPPVALACAECASILETGRPCPCPSRTTWVRWHGIPRVLGGDAAPPNDPAGRIENTKKEPGYREEEGAGLDLLLGLPWEGRETVLDVGGAAGLAASWLPARVARLIAVVPEPEHALALRDRLRRRGVRNVNLLIADPRRLAFAAASFDVIALHGVVEALAGKEQEALLRRAADMLRPRGVIYVAARTRHADRRLRRSEVRPGPRDGRGGSESPRGPRGCRRLLARAGFRQIEGYGCFPEFRRQWGSYPLDAGPARREVQRVVNPPCSWRGRLWRVFRDATPLSRRAEEVILLARKADAVEGALTWEPGPARPVAQLNTCDKVLLVGLPEGRPSEIAKAGKFAGARERLQREYHFLNEATARLGERLDRLPVRWPYALGTTRWNGLEFFRYEYVRGTPLSQLLFPGWLSVTRFLNLFARLVDGYVELADAARDERPCIGPDAGSPRTTAPFQEIGLEDPALERRLAAALDKLRAGRWRTGFTQGDLSLNNAIRTADGRIILIDWESVSVARPVGVDLVRLLYDAWSDCRILRGPVRERLVSGFRSIITAALARVGVGEDEIEEVEALFVAEQGNFILSRRGDPTPIVRNYGDRPFGRRL